MEIQDSPLKVGPDEMFFFSVFKGIEMEGINVHMRVYKQNHKGTRIGGNSLENVFDSSMVLIGEVSYSEILDGLTPNAGRDIIVFEFRI